MLEAAYHAAMAEIKMRRPEKAQALVETAVRLHPGHVLALGLLAERAIENGEVEQALGLLERQAAATIEPAEASRPSGCGRRDSVGVEAAGDEFERALEGDAVSTALLDKLLLLERDAGQIERAAELAARLVDRATDKIDRARRLREAAALDASRGKTDGGGAAARLAGELDPLAHEATAGLSALLVARGDDNEAAQLLTRALPLLPPPPADDAVARAVRATLWLRLGECRDRLRDTKGALAAFEKALEADPSRRALRETLLARYGDDAAHDEVARGHHAAILAGEPLHASSLRAMARIDGRSANSDGDGRAGSSDGGRRFLELLAVAGALGDDERRKLAAMPPLFDDAQKGALDEADHVRLAHAEALPLGPVFAALWEGSAPLTPDMAQLGVSADDRVSPVAASELARAYSAAARILGNRKTGLYLKAAARPDEVVVMAHPPTGVIVSPRLVEGRAAADVRFIVGRALEIARPEYVLGGGDDAGRVQPAVRRHPARVSSAPLAPQRGRRGGQLAQAAPLQSGAAAGRAVPRPGRHRLLVGQLAARGAAHRQPRRAPGGRRHGGGGACAPRREPPRAETRQRRRAAGAGAFFAVAWTNDAALREKLAKI